MPLTFTSENDFQWIVRKIVVVGPGIVGMPMAALLADAKIREGSDEPAKVLVLQRNSENSGWKVAAINRGETVIGGVEPGLDAIAAQAVKEGILSATSSYDDVADADMILVSVQTDKDGFGPDYGPLFGALEGVAKALVTRPKGNVPVVVFESTLAPSSMTTVVRDLFARHGLIEGKDVLLGNSPNRVMPGRLVERVAESDKLIAGLHPLTPVLIKRIYSKIVTKGVLHQTNSMTAEVVKTLENAYRDVRIAFAAELVRQCDANDIDFFALRDQVNARLNQSDNASGSATAVPSGAILVPSIGVGGHCLPKDGILLWWRKYETGADTSRSLILKSRVINDEAPLESIKLAEKTFGKIDGKKIALLGAAYRFDSEDTRNSPTLSLGKLLIERGCDVRIHDPYVKPDDQNLKKFGLTGQFTNDLVKAIGDADFIFFCVGHGVYGAQINEIVSLARSACGVFDGANLFAAEQFAGRLSYAGIGRGTKAPTSELTDFTIESFKAMEQGVANELNELIEFLNDKYATDVFNQVSLDVVRQLAGTCVTGCEIGYPTPRPQAPNMDQFSMRLVGTAAAQPA